MSGERKVGNHLHRARPLRGDRNLRRPDLLLMDLKPYTTFGVAGRAERFVQVRSPEELVAKVKEARRAKLPYYLIAGGSNVVFSDENFPGLIIRYFNPRGKISHQVRRGRLIVDAGVPLGQLIKAAIKNNLAGMETLSGIPGTVGGAIVGNAGAYGQSILDCLVRVQIFDGQKVKWLTKKQCQFTYRHSVFKEKKGSKWLILRAEFKLKRGDKKELAKKSREIIKIRLKKYNPSLRCPGSFFKNVLVKDISKKSLKLIDPNKIRGGKIPAGYLLETVGAKGMRVGDIYVAGFHGNLLVNDGHGTYRDVITLATKLKKLVKAKFGITLEEEVRYIV